MTRSICFAALVALCASCASSPDRQALQQEIQNLDAALAEQRARADSLQGENGRLKARLNTLEAEAAGRSDGSLEGGLRDLRRRVAAAEGRMSEELARLAESLRAVDPGVRTVERPEGLAIQVADTVLFASGQAKLSDRGQGVLRELAPRIAGHAGGIRVEGHTDNDPVVKTRDRYPRGNIELSGERALVVAVFLAANGVPAKQVSYAGYGQHRPDGPNDSAEGKARNRRVEILLLGAK